MDIFTTAKKTYKNMVFAEKEFKLSDFLITVFCSNDSIKAPA